MPAFRTVDGSEAGPAAVGILVPPGRRTVVVLRPRSLDVDLLLVRRGPDGTPGTGFHEGGPGEAAVLAQGVSHALVRSANGKARIETQQAAEGGGHWLRVGVGAFVLLVCPRLPGQAYRPLTFATIEETQPMAKALAAVLCPGPDANQELYLNTQFFGRPGPPPTGSGF
ncbi:MAG: hypothetical protein K2R98_28070 [Gemmataceae bacterium]|nr:hypothetical protein [Gemmataceae bacterium]